MNQQVFISYSNESHIDRQIADTIYDTLKARGIPCWVAHRDIAAGQNWPTEISKAISNSRIMIVVLSKHTEKSSYVSKEVTLASNGSLTIIPFCIEEVSLSEGLNFLLGDCQWINAYPHLQDKNLDRLVEALQSYLGIEPGKTFKKEEKPIEVKKEPPEKKNEGNTKKSHQLKRILVTASIIIAIIAAVFFISQLINNKITTPGVDTTEKPGNLRTELYAGPDFIRFLKSKGWDVKKNENDCWEGVYEVYDLAMIYIPKGKFIMGADDGADEEKPSHNVYLDGYWIGKYEVTFNQYDRYCEETGKEKPGDLGWGRENRPVINISWGDAGAYCDWISQKTGLNFDLPSEAQWEKAARGPNGLIYPWGKYFEKNKCNSDESGMKQTMPVGTYPSGKSRYGCMDMAGNVYEWCSDWYDEDYYKISPAKNPLGPTYGSRRLLHGGSWLTDARFCRASSRISAAPSYRSGSVGFRLLMIR